MEKMESIEELISSALCPPSVSSKMVLWKGHRPGVGQARVCPAALGASQIPPPGLSFLTSKMGLKVVPFTPIYQPHGFAVRLCRDWKNQDGGHSKGKVALGKARMF